MKNNFYVAFIAMIIAFLIATCTSNSNIIEEPLDRTRFIDLQGHRGARGLSPENTISAFKTALKYKMTTLELDTNLTSDNHLIVYHDSKVNSEICLNRDGQPAQSIPILQLSVEDLKALDCTSTVNTKFKEQIPVKGEKLVTLAEFFEFIKEQEKLDPAVEQIKFNIEIKLPKGYEPLVLETMSKLMVKQIVDHGMVERAVVQSFESKAVSRVKVLNNNIKTSLLVKPSVYHGIKIVSGLEGDYDAVIAQGKKLMLILSRRINFTSQKLFVARAHKNGLKVIPWTINEPKEIINALNNNVDGVISDYPDRLQNAYKLWKNKQ